MEVVKTGKHSCCSADPSAWMLQCERRKDGRRREKVLSVRIRENYREELNGTTGGSRP